MYILFHQTLHKSDIKVGCDVPARTVLAKFEAVQDEEARAEGLPENHPGRLG